MLTFVSKNVPIDHFVNKIPTSLNVSPQQQSKEILFSVKSSSLEGLKAKRSKKVCAFRRGVVCSHSEWSQSLTTTFVSLNLCGAFKAFKHLQQMLQIYI